MSYYLKEFKKECRSFFLKYFIDSPVKPFGVGFSSWEDFGSIINVFSHYKFTHSFCFLLCLCSDLHNSINLSISSKLVNL